MKKLNIERIILKKGATLDGGFNPISAASGYMVSIKGHEKQLKINDIEQLEATIIEYRKDLQKNEYIGIWINKDIIYIDKSKHYKDKYQAIKVAKDNEICHVYSIDNFDTLPKYKLKQTKNKISLVYNY